MFKLFKKREQKLWEACNEGKVQKVQRLLQNSKLNTNWQDSDGDTAFVIACANGHSEIVKLLLNDNRVEVNKANEYGETPFYIACEKGRIEIVKLFLNNERVDINKEDNKEATPFMAACREGQFEIVKLLLNDQRVDVNKADNYGTTPFWFACFCGHVDFVKLLLNDERNDINKALNNGITPFYAACIQGHTEVINLLRNEKNKLNLKEEVERYNQNLQQNKDIVNSIGNLRDILLYFPESITLEIKQETIKNFVQAFKNCQDDQKEAFFYTTETLSLNDETTRIFKDVGGMDVLINSFIQSTKEVQQEIPLINIVNHNQLFREYLGKNQESLKTLTTLLNEAQSMKLKLNFAGIMLSLAGYISNKEIVKKALESIIFPIIRNDQPSKVYMNNALDCLMESSSIDSSKSILLEFGTKEIIQLFVDDQDSPYHFISCIIQAFLSSNDVNQNNEFGSNPTSSKVISKILDVLNTFINTETQFYEYNEGYFIDCFNILKALGSLARNEANMKELKNNGIVKRIIEFSQNRKDNLLKTSNRTIEELSTLIWILSFDQDCKNSFLSNGIIETLKAFNVKDNESVKKAVDGALFILIGNQNQNQNQNRNEIKGQVMISYCWEEKEKARKIANYLKSKNIPVWIDIEQMEGSVLEAMAEAVEESSVILVFLSSKYKESQACRTEAEYAYKLKKEVICIMAEDNYQPRGWLGALLGNKLWYNLWENSMFIEKLFLPILSQLSKILNQPEIVTQTQEKNQDQNSKPIQVTQQSQSTNNDYHNQQILNLLEKIVTKMDGFENRLQKTETQNQENYEKMEQKFGIMEQRLQKVEENFEKLETQNKENLEALDKMNQSIQKLEIQNKENFEKMGTNSAQQFEQMLEKLEKKKKSMFGK